MSDIEAFGNYPCVSGELFRNIKERKKQSTQFVAVATVWRAFFFSQQIDVSSAHHDYKICVR